MIERGGAEEEKKDDVSSSEARRGLEEEEGGLTSTHAVGHLPESSSGPSVPEPEDT